MANITSSDGLSTLCMMECAMLDLDWSLDTVIGLYPERPYKFYDIKVHDVKSFKP
jgi:hypothetical protein